MVFAPRIMKNLKQFQNRASALAFSLVETVLALGIMGLAITALLGLLPQGIEMSRQAANAAAISRIVDTVVGQLSMVPFSDLQNQEGGQPLRFDDQGVLVTGTEDEDQSTFLVRIRSSNASGGAMQLPGAVTNQVTMRKVLIQIVQTPLRTFDFDGAQLKAPRSFYTVPVVFAPLAGNMR